MQFAKNLVVGFDMLPTYMPSKMLIREGEGYPDHSPLAVHFSPPRSGSLFWLTWSLSPRVCIKANTFSAPSFRPACLVSYTN